MSQTISASVQSAVAVTPNDTATVSMDALWVGGGGNLSLDYGDGAVVFANVPAGVFFETAGCIVRATGTTATSLVAVKWNRNK